MKWKRFEDEMPSLDSHLLILMETMVGPERYLHWISSGKFTLHEGLTIHAPWRGQCLPSRPLKWTLMIDLPCESTTEDSLQ